VVTNKKSINVVNDVGPQSKVELYEKKGDNNEAEDTLICVKTFENQDSAPNSPSKGMYYMVDFSEDINEDKDRYVSKIAIFVSNGAVVAPKEMFANLTWRSITTLRQYLVSSSPRSLLRNCLKELTVTL
jgi:hypothetical protein